MEGRDIGLEFELAEEALFVAGGVDEEAQGLVAVAGEDHVIEILSFSGGRHHGDAARGADDPGGGLAEVQAVAERDGDFFDVGFGAAIDGPPLVLSGEAEKAVIVKEAQERGGGKGEHLLGRGAPDGGAHGHEVEIKKIFAVTATAHVVAQGFVLSGRIVEGGDGFAVEAVDRSEHPIETRTEEIAALGEEVVEGGAGEFEPSVGVTHAERHVGFFDRDVELGEEAGEVRVGHLVEDHKTGVDGHEAASAGLGGGDGIGVAAGVVVLFEQGEVEVTVEKMGAAEASDTGADNGERGHGWKEGPGTNYQGPREVCYVRWSRVDAAWRA